MSSDLEEEAQAVPQQQGIPQVVETLDLVTLSLAHLQA